MSYALQLFLGVGILCKQVVDHCLKSAQVVDHIIVCDLCAARQGQVVINICFGGFEHFKQSIFQDASHLGLLAHDVFVLVDLEFDVLDLLHHDV